MALRIGNKEVIKQETLLIPQNERATIPVSFGGSDVTVEISFSDDQSGKPDIRFSNENNAIDLTFLNWSNVVGTSTQAPIDIARNEHGHALSIMAANWRVGEANRLDLQFMVA